MANSLEELAKQYNIKTADIKLPSLSKGNISSSNIKLPKLNTKAPSSLEALAKQYNIKTSNIILPSLTKTATKISANKQDLTTPEGLLARADEIGLSKTVKKQLEREVGAEDRLSVIQRLGGALGAFNPAEAILTGIEEKSVLKGVGKYAKGIGTDIAEAVTGRDIDKTTRRTFADVAEAAGIENKWLKGGIGFVGDVLLDPTTYFGGAIVRGLIKAPLKFGAKGAKTLITKASPKLGQAIEMTEEGLKDAFGRAFSYGYKATEGAREKVLTFLSKSKSAQLGIAGSNLNRLGTGTLTKEQGKELALNMAKGKIAEFEQRELSKDIVESANWFQPLKNRLIRLLDTREKDLGKLGTEINNLEKKGVHVALKNTKEEILPTKISSTKIKTVPEKEQIVAFDKYDIPTREISPAVPLKRTATDASLVSLTARETNQFVNSLIRKSKPELEAIKKLIGTREGWKKELLDEITGLRNDFEGLAKTQQDTFKLADTVFAQRGTIAREAAKSSDPVVQKAIEDQAKRAEKFADIADISDPYTTYYPFLKKDKMDKFISDIQASGIKIGSEGYRKQFKNLLTLDNIELDPAKAFFTREAQIVSDKMTRDFLNGFVKSNGRALDAFANADDAAKSGYKVLKEKGMFGKEVGYINQWDEKLLRDSLSPEFQTINMLAKGTGFDAITSLFKRGVTGPFPSFHIRNYISGMIQNYEKLGVSALNPKTIASGQRFAFLLGKGAKSAGAGMIKVGEKEIPLNKIFNEFRDRFGGDTLYTNDFLWALENGGAMKQALPTLSKGRVMETIKTFGLGQEAIPFKLGRIVGQFVEHQQKATAYLAALGDGKNIQEALKIAESSGFDYGALTRFESQIMRRLVPFYSFARKNIQLQLETLGESPQRINHIIALLRNIGEASGEEISDEEKQYLPDYIKDSLSVKLTDAPNGLKRYIANFGTPIEAFTQLIGKNPVLRGISMMNPIMKPMIELGIGKDSFRKRDIKDVYDAKEYAKAPKIVKDILDIKEVKKDIFDKDAKGKLVKVGEKTVYAADPYRLLIARSLFTSRGVTYLNSVFNGDLNGLDKFLKATTGVKPEAIDLQMQEAFRDKDTRESIIDTLVKYEGVEQFKKAYIPKGNEAPFYGEEDEESIPSIFSQ